MAGGYAGQTYDSVITDLVERIEALEKKVEEQDKLIDVLVLKVAPEYKI